MLIHVLSTELGSHMKKLNFACLGILLLLNTVCSSAAETLPDTLEKIKPSIVAVGTYLPKRSPRSLFMGTGFAVANGTVVATNAHVIPNSFDSEHMEQLAVFIQQDKQDKYLLANLIAVDKEHDLALLKLVDAKLPVLKLGDVNQVREGQSYAFTGYPMGMILGLYPVTHKAMISTISPNAIPMLHAGSLDVKLVRRLQEPYNVFQLDATAYPGNSGSPLYDTATAEVIGIINKTFIQETKEKVLSNPSGISYAIPISYLEKLLKENGY